MALGTRVKRRRQEELFYAADVAEAPGHPFYNRLNETLDAACFDGFCEERGRTFYHDRLGRPSLAPGVYFRLQLIGLFEGVESERGMAWRVADSLSLRRFLGYGFDEATPDHVTISRTRRLLDTETYQAVFLWVLERLAAEGLLKGKTIGVDATTLEANAAMRSIVRRARAIASIWRSWPRRTAKRPTKGLAWRFWGSWRRYSGLHGPTTHGSTDSSRPGMPGPAARTPAARASKSRFRHRLLET